MISDFPRYGNDLTSSNNANLNGNDVLTKKIKKLCFILNVIQ